LTQASVEIGRHVCRLAISSGELRQGRHYRRGRRAGARRRDAHDRVRQCHARGGRRR
jgi:hypothetical protein